MSKAIDEKVVSMQFDNTHFESNVKTSLSTIEKLKQKLNFKDAGKGFDNVAAAAKNCDLHPLANGVEAVQMKFSALSVMAITALSNITNSAINTAKRVVSAFTIDPIKTGFEEYELKMGSIQTIMASTGEELGTVNEYLNELNEYSDKTIYSFSDMTQNIGKFTNAGVSLDKAVLAIKGVSNEAALSGANANEASRAMYNFAQALSAGYVKLIDWKSIENANMATVSFKNELIKTAVEMGTLTETTEGLYSTGKREISATQNFNDSLQDQWMTTDVLVETLSKYADETTDIGKRAYAAAQDVKTFSMMMDTLKEAAQSGWAATWEILVGDFVEAKSLWTELSEIFGDMIAKSAERRNGFLEDIFSSKWGDFTEEIKKAGIEVDDFKDKLKETAHEHGMNIDNMIEDAGSLEAVIAQGRLRSEWYIETLGKFTEAQTEFVESTGESAKNLEEFQNVVDEVIKGNYGNGAERLAELTEQSWDAAQVQSLVNLIWERNGKTWEDTTITAGELASTIGNLSEEEAESLGYTEEQISALQDLAQQALDTNTPIGDLIDKLDRPSGRTLFFQTIINTLQGIREVLGYVKKAWNDVMPSIDTEKIYSALEGMQKLSKKFLDFVSYSPNMKKFTNTFRAFFSIIDLIARFIGGAFKLAFESLGAIFKGLDVDFQGFDGHIAENIITFREWVIENDKITECLQTLGGYLEKAAEKVKELIDKFKELPPVQAAIEFITTKFGELKDIFSVDNRENLLDNLVENIPFLKDALEQLGGELDYTNFLELGQNIIDGLKEGIESGVTTLPQFMRDVASALVQSFRDFLGIHSPSTVFKEIGEFIIDGLVQGLGDKAYAVIDKIKEIGGKLVEWFEEANWGQIFAGALTGGGFITAYKAVSAFSTLVSPLGALSNLIKKIGGQIPEFMNGISKIQKSKAFEIRSEAIRNIAISIGILAGSLVALALIPAEKMEQARNSLILIAGILAGFAVILAVLSKNTKMVDSVKDGVKGIVGLKPNLVKMGIALVAIAVSIGIMASAIKKIGKLDPEQATQGLSAIIILCGMIVMFMGVMSTMDSETPKIGKTLIAVSAAIGIMGIIISALGKMDMGIIKQGGNIVGVMMAVLLGFIVGLDKLTKHKIGNVGGVVLSVVGALAIMTALIAVLGRMDMGVVKQGGNIVAVMIAVLFGFVVGLDKLVKYDMVKIGAAVLSVAASVLIMALATKILGSIEKEPLTRGTIVVAIFVGLIIGLIQTMKKIQNNIPSAIATLAGISVLLISMSASCLILSLLDPGPLWKAVGAIAALSVCIAMLMVASRSSKNCKGSLVALAIVIGVMTASLVALSFIPFTDLGPALGAIGGLMLVIALIVELSNKSSNLGNSRGSLIAMAAIIGALSATLIILSQLPIENTLPIAAAIGGILLALAASMYVINKTGKLGKGSTASLAVMAATLVAIGLILALLSQLPIETSIPLVASLGALLLALAAAVVIIGKAGGSSLGGAVALLALSAGLVAIAFALKLLCDVPWQSLLIAAGVLAGLVFVLVAASALMEALAPGAIALAIVVVALGAALLLGAAAFYVFAKALEIVSAILPALGTGLTALGVGFSNFILTIAMCKGSVGDFATVMSTMGTSVLALLLKLAVGAVALGAAAIVLGAGLVVAGLGLTVVSSGITSLSGAIMSLCMAISAGITMIVTSFMMLSDFASSAGANLVQGFANGITGSLGTVVESCVGFVSSIGTTICGLLGIHSPSTLAAVWGMFTGQGYAQGLDESSGEVETSATSIVDVVKGIFTDGTLTDATSQSGTDASSGFMTNMMNGIDISSLDSMLGGQVDLSQFQDMLGGEATESTEIFGTSMSEGFAGLDMSTIAADGLDFSSFETMMNEYGISGGETYTEGIAEGVDGDAISSEISSSIDLSGLSSDMSSSGQAAGESFIEGLNSGLAPARNKVIELVNQITTALNTKRAQFVASGKTLATSFVAAISAEKVKAKNAAKALAEAAARGVKINKNSMKAAGIDLGNGLIIGIDSKQSDVYNAGYRLGRAAVLGEKAGQNSKSPSKETIKAGKWLGEGLVIGINSFNDKVYDAGFKMGENAVNSVATVMSTIADVVNSDSTLEPTITPVLDMGGFDSQQLQLSAGISAVLNQPVETMSQMMINAQAEINESNNRVISALNDLRDDLAAIFEGDDREIAFYVDSRKLASTIARPMNRQLNSLLKRGGI